MQEYHNLLYLLQASLRDPLELGYFACREVNVSFAILSVHMEYQPSHLPLKLQYMVVR